MIVGLLTETVTVLNRVQATDGAGQPVYDDYGEPVWAAPEETDVAGCSVQPQGTSEALSDQEHVVTTWKLWGPVNMPLLSTSQVRAHGVLYDVSGDPQTWHTGLGLNHTEVELTRWTG